MKQGDIVRHKLTGEDVMILMVYRPITSVDVTMYKVRLDDWSTEECYLWELDDA